MNPALLLAAACLTTLGAAPSPRVAAADKPNVVYILADDMGYGDVSCLNEKSAWKTVHMDRLAAEGMVFTDAHSGSAVCTPTRYGILTGRYAWRSRSKRGVLGGASEHLIDPDRMTVADLLKKNGYHTACIGKWHLGWDWPKGENGKGIDYSRPVRNGPSVNGFDTYYCHSGSLDMAPYVYVENDRVTAPPDRTTENKDYQGFWRKGSTGADFRHADVLPNFTRRAVEYIQSRAREKTPFFLYLALAAPHTPILPTKEFEGKSGTNPYGDFVLQVDDTVGRVMKAVDAAGIAENTIFIMTSDNGCSPRARFEELERFGHDPSHVFRGHKADIFEGGHRIPFLVRWPSRVKPGSRSDETICLTDLVRTCSDILGDPLPDDAGEDSVSFLPALRGEKTGKPLREATIHHSINGSFAIRMGKWKLALCPGSGGWSAPKPAQAFKQELPLVQLFDLANDIGETKNLSQKRGDVVRRMIDRLEKTVRDGRSTPGKPQKNEGKTNFLPKGYSRRDAGEQATAPSLRGEFGKAEIVYKTLGDIQLKLHVYSPSGKTKEGLAAIVFFFGGGWNGGNPSQFFPHCEHLASRGMVAVSAEYRVESRHKTTPFECVEDARSAIRYIRRNARKLGIDPNRIAAGGGSAGGHLAAATATVTVPSSETEEKRASSRPDALVLFNPVFDNGPEGYGYNRVKDRYREISPLHNLEGKKVPPTVVFLGTRDNLIPVSTARKYKELMESGGNRCDLHLYEDQPHGFFNYRKGENEYYGRTVEAMDRFLEQLGFLK